jgi:hypothetical protein
MNVFLSELSSLWNASPSLLQALTCAASWLWQAVMNDTLSAISTLWSASLTHEFVQLGAAY